MAIIMAASEATSEAATKYFPAAQKDIVATPIAHDSAGEISQANVKDWYKGECEAIPGKTMHKLAIVDRDYTQLYDKFIRLGPGVRDNGLGAHGTHYKCEDYYDELTAFDEIEVHMRLTHQQQNRIGLAFEYYRCRERQSTLVACGVQEIQRW